MFYTLYLEVYLLRKKYCDILLTSCFKQVKRVENCPDLFFVLYIRGNLDSIIRIWPVIIDMNYNNRLLRECVCVCVWGFVTTAHAQESPLASKHRITFPKESK